MGGENDELGKVARVAGTAALAAVDPTGGVAAAMVIHAATTMKDESTWRRIADDFWVEVILENESERRRQYDETQDEFNRHRLVLEWLQEEVERVRGRVQAVEGIVLHLVAQSGELLKACPDPEMRPYLAKAFENAVRHPGRFRASWVARLSKELRSLDADHLALLVEMVESATKKSKGGYITQLSVPDDPERFLALQELTDRDFVQRGSRDARVTILGAKLALFVGARTPDIA